MIPSGPHLWRNCCGISRSRGWSLIRAAYGRFGRLGPGAFLGERGTALGQKKRDNPEMSCPLLFPQKITRWNFDVLTRLGSSLWFAD